MVMQNILLSMIGFGIIDDFLLHSFQYEVFWTVIQLPLPSLLVKFCLDDFCARGDGLLNQANRLPQSC